MTVIERRTETPSTDANAPNNQTSQQTEVNKTLPLKAKSLDQKNILNTYRSVTYNFTLAALKRSAVNDPEQYRNSELELVILKSGGKGVTGFNNKVEGVERKVGEQVTTLGFESQTTDITGIDFSGKDLVEGFNKESPGRFDMFIENVEIETLMTYNEKSNVALGTKLTFDVIEPYSINGFIEAIHVAAVAAGYVSYTQASYILKMEFIGYPDTGDLPLPEQVQGSVRYFVIGFTGIEVDISEKGTRYKCKAIPWNEKGYGQPNVLVKPIKMTGVTVGEILDNFMFELTKQNKENLDATKVNSNLFDEYEVRFPIWDSEKGWIEGKKGERRNTIADSALVDLFRDNALFAMSEPGKQIINAYKADEAKDKQPTPSQNISVPASVKYVPNQTVVHFNEKMIINDAITAVIRDSRFTRNILENPNNIDPETGMIKYFMIRLEVKNKEGIQIDELSKKPPQLFSFIVTEYETHYTRIPGFGSNRIEEDKIRKITLRDYDYIYTGSNVDVMAFKLQFNTLFFEALPAAMGNKDTPAAKTGASNNNNPDVKIRGHSLDCLIDNPIGDPKTIQSSEAGSISRDNQPNAGQNLNSPYDILAKNMHEAIIDSKASMITGDLDILGDPLYLVTGGMGNYNPKPAENNVSDKGEALFLNRELLISINFRNPIDIRPAEEGGTMFFDPKRAPFSGVYRVLKVNSTFRDGEFKQRLNIMRLPGQLLDKPFKDCGAGSILKPVPAPVNTVVQDSTRGTSRNERLPNESVLSQIAAETSIQTDQLIPQPGGLAVTPPARNFGLVNRAGQLISNSVPIGKPLTPDLSSEIRLKSSGLGNLNLNQYSTPALIESSSAVLTKSSATKQTSKLFADTFTAKEISNARKKFNIGSGIGQGASISIASEENNLSTTVAENVISGTENSIKNFSDNVINAVSDLGNTVNKKLNSPDQTINSVGDKTKSLLGSSRDPDAVSANLEFDTAKVAGIGGNLISKSIGKFKALASSGGNNANLKQSLDAGFQIDFLPKDSLKNLPPPAPFVSAPGTPAIESISDIINPLSQEKNLNPVDKTVNAFKIDTARKQLQSISGVTPIPDLGAAKSVSSVFGSNQAYSPLNRLINNLTKK